MVREFKDLAASTKHFNVFREAKKAGKLGDVVSFRSHISNIENSKKIGTNANSSIKTSILSNLNSVSIMNSSIRNDLMKNPWMKNNHLLLFYINIFVFSTVFL